MPPAGDTTRTGVPVRTASRRTRPARVSTVASAGKQSDSSGAPGVSTGGVPPPPGAGVAGASARVHAGRAVPSKSASRDVRRLPEPWFPAPPAV